MGFELGLAGKSVLVTGAGSGIGLAVALQFAEQGANVAIVDVEKDAAERTAAEARSKGVRACAIVADVSIDADVNDAVSEAERQLGPLQVLINNAGIAERRPFLELPSGAWRRVLDVNLTGVFLVTQAVVSRMMAEERRGAIVNVASVAGLTGVFNRTAYSAAKHGVVGFTRTLALELARHQIRVNAVAPGGVDTNLIAGLSNSPGSKERVGASHPLGRLALPSEVADIVLFLASPRADFITGSIVAIDGDSWPARHRKAVFRAAERADAAPLAAGSKPRFGITQGSSPPRDGRIGVA